MLQKRVPHEKEYLQTVKEFLDSIEPFLAQNPRYASHAILERLVEPERIIVFRVAWMNQDGKVEVNRGYRVQHNSTLGIYKGVFGFIPLSIFPL